MRKMTDKQLAKWLQSLPETMNLWELGEDVYTAQQATAALNRYAAERRAAAKLHADLNAIDSLLTACAENDAFDNMPRELTETNMLGYYRSFHNHLANAAQVHWETAGRDVNAELGRVII